MATLKVVPAAIVALIVLTGCSSSEPMQTALPQTGPAKEPTVIGRPANVTRVVDGDTIEVALENEIVTVRLIGIDTPETVDPNEPVGCYGHEASDFTTGALQGRPVLLEFDVERLDRYGRTLAYVWLGDELFNETLVDRGFAQVTTYPPNVKYVDRFLAAQRDARSHERGLWGLVCNEPEPPTAGGGGGRVCDPSYPTVCIPPPPPDLDCADAERLGYSNFPVRPPDPHGFDEVSADDPDVIGCET